MINLPKMPDQKTGTLFDQSTLRQLDQLMLVAQRTRAGVMKGERRSTRKGTSLEFADYREYSPGDDLRQIDWNVYARLDRPYIKLFEEEEELAVHVLIDLSTSMDWPPAIAGSAADAANKSICARRIAAGLGYLTLGRGDSLTVTALNGAIAMAQSGDQRGSQAAYTSWGVHRGRVWTLDMLHTLEAWPIGGRLDLNSALQDYAARMKRGGLLVLISDLLSAGGCETGLNALSARGFEVIILHTLAPDERDPVLIGDLRLIDVETGDAQKVTVDAEIRTLYRRRLADWTAQIKAFCTRRDIRYVPVDTGAPWTTPILMDLRRQGRDPLGYIN